LLLIDHACRRATVQLAEAKASFKAGASAPGSYQGAEKSVEATKDVANLAMTSRI
jgi:hypothetical protein